MTIIDIVLTVFLILIVLVTAINVGSMVWDLAEIIEWIISKFKGDNEE